MSLIFYSAVHISNEFLAKRGKRARNHDDRQMLLKNLGAGQAADTYLQLYKLSRRARYECARFDPRELAKYEHLATVELPAQLK